MKLIDKDALVAEIDRRMEYLTSHEGQGVILTKVLKDHYEDLRNFINRMSEEPSSEDLEVELNRWRHEHFHGRRDKEASGEYLKRSSQLDIARHFAKWKEEQFEKNRLKHCNTATNEQVELEQGFIDQHLDKYQCMPTFLDAIEYGMEYMKQQMMKEVIHGEVVQDIYSRDLRLKTANLKKYSLQFGDKVKLIIVKED